MTTYTVDRSDNVALVFDGELLANLSSREPRDTRWTEIRIYRTNSGRYVTEMIGRTEIPGEYDRVQVNVFDRPDDVRTGLLRTRKSGPKKGEKYLTVLAERALTLAADQAPELQTALTERI